MKKQPDNSKCASALRITLSVTLICVSLILFASISGAGSASSPSQGVPSGQLSQQVGTGSIGPGTVIEVQSSDVPFTPTAAQIAAHQQLLDAKSKHLAPPLGPHTTAADVGPAGGPPTETFGQEVSPNDFAVFKNSVVNSTCAGCGQSTVNEPSAANSGKTVIETSNWNISYTLNGGAVPIVWSNREPLLALARVLLRHSDRLQPGP